MYTRTDRDIVDLDSQQDTGLLESFTELYNRVFCDPSEWEDPKYWPGLLGHARPSPLPLMYLSVIPDGNSNRVKGGIVYEYYRESGCALLTYLAVDTAYRQSGIARRLVTHAFQRLVNLAIALPEGLNAVFCEMEDPSLMNGRESAIDPEQRRTVMRRFGLRRVPIPYVQPELSGGGGRSLHLLLATIPLVHDCNTLQGGVVRRFLHEFYRALGVIDPDSDPDFRAMAEALEPLLQLGDL